MLAARSADGHGSTVHLTLHGDRSGLTRDADVYLAAAYTDPAQADVHYPVVAAATPPVQLDIRTFPGDGHNQGAVRAQLPALVDWWGRHLPGPLADPASLGPGVVVQGPPGIPPRALPDPGAPAPGQG